METVFQAPTKSLVVCAARWPVQSTSARPQKEVLSRSTIVARRSIVPPSVCDPRSSHGARRASNRGAARLVGLHINRARSTPVTPNHRILLRSPANRAKRYGGGLPVGETSMLAQAGRDDNLMHPVTYLHATRGRFGS